MNYFNEKSYEDVNAKAYDKKAMGEHTTCSSEMSMNMNMGMDMGMNYGCGCMPVYECPRERVCHRYICYNVPHIIPYNTRIINHHVYRHTYEPAYTCCEENVCENVFDRCC